MRPRGDAPGHVTFAAALRFWTYLGFVSFGGPAGQIAIMHRELVERRAWISERRFLHALNYCMVLPGPEAQQLATYIGWLLHGTWGGIVAGGLFVLPSLFILVALSWIYVTYGSVPAVAAVLYGVKPAVVAIVLAAAWRIGTRALRHPALWALAAAALLSLALFGAPFPAVIIAAGLIGFFGGRIAPKVFDAPLHPPAKGTPERAIIDDDTPPPAHARFSAARLVHVIATFVLIWAVAFGALVAVLGWDNDLTRMGRFFTQAAFLTFGGAYAVLPYVVQAAVEAYGWITAPQMMDGLALGETTPGPLIMIVAFVGYVGAVTKHVFGDASFLAGAAGATVATFFTFLPSFLFILAGGPLVERTRDEPHLTAPLTAITAAVVGVIVNLALFFAWHVFWPEGRPDFASIAIAAIAIVLLVWKRLGVIPVVLGSGAAGLALWAAGLQGAM
jgi:chromate transporter